MGGGRKDGQRIELGIQPLSLCKEVSQDLDTWREILLEEKPKGDSKKHGNPHLCSSRFIEMFCILFLDTFKVYSGVSLVVKNSMQFWIWRKVV